MNRLLWPELRRSALIALVCCGLGIAALVAAYQEWHSGRQQINTLQQRLRDVQQRLSVIEQNRQEMQAAALRYDNFKQRGWVGEVQQRRWQEIIEAAAKSQYLPLPVVEIATGQRLSVQKLTGSAAVTTANAPMHINALANAVTVNLQEVSEEDVLAFIAQIKKEVPALPLLRRCQLAPAVLDVADVPAALTAVCVFDFITWQP